MRCTFMLLAVIFLFAGCGQYQIPEVSDQHPASPQATAAPEIEFVSDLSPDEAHQPMMPPEMKTAPMHEMKGM